MSHPFRDERRHHANYPSTFGDLRESYYFDGVTVRTHYLAERDLGDAWAAGVMYVRPEEDLGSGKRNTLERLFAELTILDMLARHHRVTFGAAVLLGEHVKVSLAVLRGGTA